MVWCLCPALHRGMVWIGRGARRSRREPRFDYLSQSGFPTWVIDNVKMRNLLDRVLRV